MVLRITFATIFVLAFSSDVFAGEGWYHSYDEARSASEREGVPLLIHFHASYCGPCRQMSSQVFSQPEVQHQLRKGIASVEIDVQHRQDLVQQFGVSSVPADVVVFPGGRSEVVNSGFKSTFAYLDLLRSVAARGASKSSVKPSEPVVKIPEKKANTAGKPAQLLTGLEGFCPVKLMKDREWILGKENLTESYRGITYNFTDEEARGEFRRNPAKYTPQNLGCDPVTLYADQQAIPGEIKYGAFFDNQLFLFESFENRKAFKDNPLKYGRIRHALKVDDLTTRRIQ